MRDLRRLVRVREIWERREKAQVARAIQASRAAAAQAAERAEQHEAALTDPGTVDPMLAHTSRTATWEAFSVAEHHARAAAIQEEATRGVWRRAKQELEITERLEDRRRQAAALETERKETKVLDEVAANRHGRSA